MKIKLYHQMLFEYKCSKEILRGANVKYMDRLLEPHENYTLFKYKTTKEMLIVVGEK